jgi:hypothetical protein
MAEPFMIIDPLSFPAWDTLVSACRTPSFFHTSGWARVLHDSYGYRPCYVARIEDNRLTALLPIMEVKSFLTGIRAVSLPFTDYCDPIVPDQNSGRKILEFLHAYGECRIWRSWELRGGDVLFGQTPPTSRYVRHVLDLPENADTAYRMFTSSTRRNIKKADRKRVAVLRENTLSAMRTYYQLHCLTRKRHGLPPQPWRFFQKLHEHVIGPGQGQVILGYYQGRTIAGAIILHCGSEAIYKFGASDRRYLHLRPNDVVMWNAIQYYIKAGYSQFSFGRTDLNDAGLRKYKHKWGAKEKPLQYYKYNMRDREFMTQKISTGSLMTRIFQIIPISVSKAIGNIVYRHVG